MLVPSCYQVYLSCCLSVCLSVCLYMCQYVFLSIYVSVYLYVVPYPYARTVCTAARTLSLRDIYSASIRKHTIFFSELSIIDLSKSLPLLCKDYFTKLFNYQ